MAGKYALVLSGGAFKGAFQVGALNYLRDNWKTVDPDATGMHFDIIAGVSVGSLNGAMMAMARQKELNDLWETVAANGVGEIFRSDFLKTTPGGEETTLALDFERLRARLLPNLSIGFCDGVRFVFSRQKFLQDLLARLKTDLDTTLPRFRSLADNSPLKAKLERLMDKEAITNCKFFCGFVSLNSGGYSSILHSDFLSNGDFINGILASTAMPVVWDPVGPIKHKRGTEGNCVDGGVRNVSPLGDVIGVINQEQADEEYTIVIINCSDGTVASEDADKSNIAQIALRSLADIAITEIFNNDIQQFVRINSMLGELRSTGSNVVLHDYDFEGRRLDQGKVLKHFRAIVIQPEKDSLGDSLSYNRRLHELRMQHGAAKAKAVLAKYPEEGIRKRGVVIA